MKTYLVAFLLSTISSIALTPLIRKFAFKIGALDIPDKRKIHSEAIPRIGGLAIVAAFFAPLTGLIIYSHPIGELFTQNTNFVLGLYIGGLAIMALGFVDDLYNIRARYKLIGQILIVFLVYLFGFKITSINLPFIGSISFGAFSIIATMFWILGLVNAMNLIDGLDGLASGVAFLACITNLAFGLHDGNVLLCLFSVSLAGAILGFLFFNFNPAKIFMGDSGSMFLGFILAVTAIFSSAQKKGTALAVLIPLVGLGVPIMDMLVSIIRRFVEQRPIFTADKGHFHHMLLNKGFSQRKVVLFLYGTSIVFTGLAVLMTTSQDIEIGLLLIVLIIVIVGLIRIMGYNKTIGGNIKNWYQTRVFPIDTLMNSLPELADNAKKDSNMDELYKTIINFVKQSQLNSMSLVSTGSRHKIEWKYKNKSPKIATKSRKMYTSVSIHFFGDSFINYRFAWHSPTSKIPQTLDNLYTDTAKILTKNIERIINEQEKIDD